MYVRFSPRAVVLLESVYCTYALRHRERGTEKGGCVREKMKRGDANLGKEKRC